MHTAHTVFLSREKILPLQWAHVIVYVGEWGRIRERLALLNTQKELWWFWSDSCPLTLTVLGLVQAFPPLHSLHTVAFAHDFLPSFCVVNSHSCFPFLFTNEKIEAQRGDDSEIALEEAELWTLIEDSSKPLVL